MSWAETVTVTVLAVSSKFGKRWRLIFWLPLPLWGVTVHQGAVVEVVHVLLQVTFTSTVSPLLLILLKEDWDNSSRVGLSSSESSQLTRVNKVAKTRKIYFIFIMRHLLMIVSKDSVFIFCKRIYKRYCTSLNTYRRIFPFSSCNKKWPSGSTPIISALNSPSASQ